MIKEKNLLFSSLENKFIEFEKTIQPKEINEITWLNEAYFTINCFKIQKFLFDGFSVGREFGSM